MIFFMIILFAQLLLLSEGLNLNFNQLKTVESTEQQQQLDEILQLQNHKSIGFSSNPYHRSQRRKKRLTEECADGRYCKSGSFCGRLHPEMCIPIGNTECSNIAGSCSSGFYCGKKYCIPIGHVECPDGNYCSNKTYYCSKFHPGNCFPNGQVECPNFVGSCSNGYYCGKKQCWSIGREECPNGEISCDNDHYCSQNSTKCIPRGRAECPRANQLGYCRYGEECIRDACVPEGRLLCPDNAHHCDKETQVCDPYMSIVNPTNSTRGCLFKDVTNCEAYKTMEERAGCGQNGFLLGYGHKYCRRFYAHYYLLDTNEQRTLTCISNCLIKRVRHYLNLKETADSVDNSSGTNLDCDELKSAGKEMQQKCYKKCQLCSLTFTNIHPIWSIITNDLTSIDERRQIRLMCQELGFTNEAANAAQPENNNE